VVRRLYAPWRSAYLKSPQQACCIFCLAATQPANDENHFVLKRFEHTYIMLNAYPYNGGHLMVVPYQHVNALGLLPEAARCELIEVSLKAIDLLQQELKPDGFNLGMNLGGRAAGGSIPEHIHMHVLPRWQGDTGFLPALANTKPISADLPALYQRLRTALSSTS
jgi:ATP adenylyltransferase